MQVGNPGAFSDMFLPLAPRHLSCKFHQFHLSLALLFDQPILFPLTLPPTVPLPLFLVWTATRTLLFLHSCLILPWSTLHTAVWKNLLETEIRYITSLFRTFVCVAYGLESVSQPTRPCVIWPSPSFPTTPSPVTVPLFSFQLCCSSFRLLLLSLLFCSMSRLLVLLKWCSTVLLVLGTSFNENWKVRLPVSPRIQVFSLWLLRSSFSWGGSGKPDLEGLMEWAPRAAFGYREAGGKQRFVIVTSSCFSLRRRALTNWA